MKDIAIADVRNFALLGHTGSGKTSLGDALLFKLGMTDRLGSVSAGTSMSDYTDEEISRKISIYAKSFTGMFKSQTGKTIQMVFTDTPGSDDFYGQVLCATRVADAALIVVDAASGLQMGATKAWKRCVALNIPRGIVITGLDRENTDFAKTLAEIQRLWGRTCVPVVFPLPDAPGVVDVLATDSAPGPAGELLQTYKNALIERAAESDDALIEKYLGGEALSAQEIAKGLRVAVRSGGLVPVFAAIAPKEIGVVELLEGITRLWPSPAELIIKDAEGRPVNAAPDAPLVGLVWRTVTDPYAGKLAFMRIYGGLLKEDMEVMNVTKNQKEHIGVLLTPNGKKPVPVTEARAGDIIALPKLKSVGLNDVICAVGHKAAFEPIVFPSPVVFLAVSAKEQSDEDKIGVALARVTEDDPTLKVERHADTREVVIAGMGDAHIEVFAEQMKKRGNVGIDLRIPKVAYRETVASLGDGHYKHKKQSGGRGQYAEVYAKVAPLKPGEEWFVDAIVGGVIPRNFVPACEKGFVEAMAHGVQAGFPVVAVQVTVYDGSFHEVDSSEIAFKIAAMRAFKDAMSKARPVLLEPVMQVKVMVPNQFMGDITGGLNHKRGRILGVDVEDGLQVVTADVPQAEMFRYSSELRSITGGRGSFEMKFLRYDIVPGAIAQKIVETAEKEKGKEEED